ncbi:hypothetical protein T11_18558 [Trichinella zimbabwensis]|uniref:Uncharacterized protein n=1 Tax=Trichinella zimbabwensis TaxID=268475 RepID=A0A0V1GFI3_9BILA|nr:hypothetical protein T11_18558 [Trichinella zimbabwensis]
MSQLKQFAVFHLFCISRNLLIKMRLTPTEKYCVSIISNSCKEILHNFPCYFE